MLYYLKCIHILSLEFDTIISLLETIKRAIVTITVGNKDDDPAKKVVQPSDARRFADQMGVEMFETSAKESKNVEEMFMAITRQVLKARKEQVARQAQQPQPVGGTSVRLTDNGKQSKNRNKNCCR